MQRVERLVELHAQRDGVLHRQAVDPGPQRPSTALFERMLTRTDLFTQVVRLDPASPATPPADYVATIEGRCTYHRGGWLPILPILTYKNLDEVMARQSDLVEIIAWLRPVVCVKG